MLVPCKGTIKEYPGKRWLEIRAHRLAMILRPTNAEREFSLLCETLRDIFISNSDNRSSLNRKSFSKERRPISKLAGASDLVIEKQKIFFDFLSGKAYITDFYIPSIRLAIEIDGSIHKSEHQIKYDKTKDESLGLAGCKVLRISNEEANSKSTLSNLMALLNIRKPKPKHKIPINNKHLIDEYLANGGIIHRYPWHAKSKHYQSRANKS